MSDYGLSLCIGETYGGSPFPVFYDPHYPIRVSKGSVSLITGGSGSGKTFLGMLIAAHASLLGKVGFILDPKGDFKALKVLEQAGDINRVRLWSVVPEEGKIEDENEGMLDPTAFYDKPKDNTALTIDVITALCGGEITHKQITKLTPILNDITENPNPSFSKVVSKLQSKHDDEIRALGYRLETVLGTSVAKLLSINKRTGKKKDFILGDEIVVIDLAGLEMPLDTKPSKDYSNAERVSVIILSLISTAILNMMKHQPVNKYKILLIDEAWVLMSTNIGRSMIKGVGRLGRSRNLATVLMTQSSKHLDTEGEGEGESDMDTLISERFAFRNADEEENYHTVQMMKLPSNEGWEQFMSELPKGVCLMQNTNYESAFVHILAKDEWVDKFNTTPISADM